MEHILRKYPFNQNENNDKTEEHEAFMKSLRTKNSIEALQNVFNATSEQVLNLFLTSIKAGLHITFQHLKEFYGIDDDAFDLIKTNMDPVDTTENLTNVKRKCLQEAQVPHEKIALVVTFVRVRDHLNALNVTYYDPAHHKLINTHLLFNHSNSKPINPCTSTETSSTATLALTTSMKNTQDVSFDDDDGYDECLGNLCDEYCGTSSANNIENKTYLSGFESKKPPTMPSVSINQPIACKDDNSSNASNEKMTSAGSGVTIMSVNKRVNIKPKSKVVYCSESDSDENDSTTAKPTEIKLSGWLSKNNNILSASNQPAAIKRRKYL